MAPNRVRVLLALLFAAGLAQAPGRALLAVYVEAVLHQPPLLTSTLIATHLLCGGLFALAGGAVSDVVSRRVAVLVGLTTGIFGSAALVIQAPAALVTVAVVYGLASGFHSTGGQSYLMAAVARRRLGTATAAYFITGTASQAVGAFLAGQAADAVGFAPVGSAAVGLGAFVVLAGALWLPSGEARGGGLTTASGSDARRLPPAEAAAVRAAMHSPGFGSQTPSPATPTPTLAGYGDLLRRPDVLALGALRYLPTTAWGIASLSFPLLIFRAGGTAGIVGVFGMVSLLAASGAQLATGRAVDRLAGRGATSGSARPLVAPLAAAILVVALGAALMGTTVPGLFVLGTLWAMAAWALSTTMPPLIHELGAGQDDGRLVALTHLLWSAGMFTGTLAAGALLDLHYALTFLLAAACLGAALAVALWFARTPHAVSVAPG